MARPFAFPLLCSPSPDRFGPSASRVCSMTDGGEHPSMAPVERIASRFPSYATSPRVDGDADTTRLDACASITFRTSLNA